MKAIVKVLVESPFYFTIPLKDRYGLIRRLVWKDGKIDLAPYREKVNAFLDIGKMSLCKLPRF